MIRRHLIVLLLLLSAFTAGAHQPRIVKTDFVQVFTPEVSQAFYGELQGQSAEFQVRNSNIMAAPDRAFA